MKKFLLKLSYTIIPIWIVLVGCCLYYSFVILPNISGDLGKLGYIPFKKVYPIRTLDSTYTFKLFKEVPFAEDVKKAKTDVLTVGDSFSQRGVEGYQNYMAAWSDLNIINYKPMELTQLNPIQSAYDLLKLGYVDSTNCKVIIVETVERALTGRLKGLSLNDKKVPTSTHTPQKVEKWSLLKARDMILFKLGNGPVKRFILKRNVFNSPSQPNVLHFYADDVNVGLNIMKEDRKVIRDNFIHLQEMAIRKGVNLFFVVCPDKYDVYQDLVVDEEHPQKTINEDFKSIVGKDDNTLVIAKDLIMPHINAGDVYV